MFDGEETHGGWPTPLAGTHVIGSWSFYRRRRRRAPGQFSSAQTDDSQRFGGQRKRVANNSMVPVMNFNVRTAAGPELDEDLERRIVQRTWGRIHQLHVERQGDQVIVRGYSPSYYIKQLALLAVQETEQAVSVQFDIQVGKAEPRPSEGRSSP